MKKIKIAQFILVTTLFSCKNDQLNNSYVYFNEPQPVNVEAVTSFPNKYIGTFNRDYSHQLKVESNCIIKIEIDSYKATKIEMDSLPDVVFKNNVVYDKETQKAFKTIIQNDTIKWENKRVDTTFSFDRDEVAKRYKSSLILNKKVNGNYLVNIIKFDFSGNKYIQFGTRKDFVKIKRQLKIPFDTSVENGDTTFVVLKPNRADFRKLLRLDGFEFEQMYYFK